MTDAIRYAVIDTEGSGLFDFSKPADADGQPRLAALAMILLNPDLTVAEEYHSYVKPDGWAVDPEAQATKVNKLTQEYLQLNGKPIAEVLDAYARIIAEGFAIAAFNSQHDLKSMRAELRRAGRPDLFEETKNVCLMRKAGGVIPKAGGKKGWPKLEEVRTFLGIPHDGAHSALVDAQTALTLLKYLYAQGVDLTPEVHFGKNRGVVLPMNDPPQGEVSRPRGMAMVPDADEEIPR